MINILNNNTMNNNDYIKENEKFINNDEIDLKEIWKAVIRKKKIVILMK